MCRFALAIRSSRRAETTTSWSSARGSRSNVVRPDVGGLEGDAQHVAVRGSQLPAARHACLGHEELESQLASPLDAGSEDRALRAPPPRLRKRPGNAEPARFTGCEERAAPDRVPAIVRGEDVPAWPADQGVEPGRKRRRGAEGDGDDPYEVTRCRLSDPQLGVRLVAVEPALELLPRIALGVAAGAQLLVQPSLGIQGDHDGVALVERLQLLELGGGAEPHDPVQLDQRRTLDSDCKGRACTSCLRRYEVRRYRDRVSV